MQETVFPLRFALLKARWWKLKSELHLKTENGFVLIGLSAVLPITMLERSWTVLKKIICIMVFELRQWNIMSFSPSSRFWPEYVSGSCRRILCVVCIFFIMTNFICLWLERSLACLLVAFFCFLMKPWIVDLNNRNYRREFLLIWDLFLDLSFRWLTSGCKGGKIDSVVSILIFFVKCCGWFSLEENVYCYLERAKVAVVGAWISKSCFFS